MFTGIISNIARVTKKVKRGGQVHFEFTFLKPEKRVPELGESLAVDGVCLTVTRANKKRFEADVVSETLKATTLGSFEIHKKVNTERCLRTGDPVGGHFVSGHVDGRGKVLKIERSGKNWILWVAAPASIQKHLKPKGSIALDGISLTLQEVRGARFKVAIVPHTLKKTALQERKAGDGVNLEADKNAPVKPKAKSRLKVQALERQGF